MAESIRVPLETENTALLKLKRGQHAVVEEILGGELVTKRLANMGIRPGTKIIKISSMLMGGPIVVSVNRRHIALGRGMASKILVSPVEP